MRPVDASPARPADLGQLRERLPERLARSPLACIERIDADADMAMFVERLTRELPAPDDLRLTCRLDSGTDVAVLAERLPWDSDFFGYGVARLDALVSLGASPTLPADCPPAIRALLDLAEDKQITYLFATVDARDTAISQALVDADFVQIETRVSYHRSLEDYESAERYAVRTATPADIVSLSDAARDTVNPFDRFHADPFIGRADADRLMAKWVEASILDGFADVTIVPDTARPRAFCTVRYHRDKWDRWQLRLAQPVFSAVSPECRGWYRKLISEIHYHLRDIGAQHTYLTTQLENASVVRSWEKLGYQHAKTEHVLRRVLRPAP